MKNTHSQKKPRKTIKSTKDLRPIEDKLSRRITLSKRRRGLLKKAYEVANICDQHVYVAIFDK